jgi:uncharacterized repeat protein (TIGR03803 family)
MKAQPKHLLILLTLIATFGSTSGGWLTAQTFTTLYSFPAIPPPPGPYTNGSGAYPDDALILSGDTLYGTAGIGGGLGNGTVFQLNTDGTGFTILHTFTGTSGSDSTNGDGANPVAGFILSSNTLYGTAYHGGTSGNGTVFQLNTDGTGFTTLHSFAATNGSPGTNSEGANPSAGLVLSGNALYGTAEHGGGSGNGTVFQLNTDGTGFTTLHSFAATLGSPGTNSDGALPEGALLLSGNTLYGTAAAGGSSGNGTVFKVNTDGTGFTTLYTFTASSGPFPFYTNSDGAYPAAGLILSGNTLYGTAEYGGSSGIGTVFAVDTNGSGFTNLHDFTDGSDGASPQAGLILWGNTLYGTAASATVFRLNTDGTGFTALHTFTGGSDGIIPRARLILSGDTLYGTTQQGGSWDNGTVFSVSSAPQLGITPSGSNVILTWPTNLAGFSYAGYTLQSTTNLVPPAVWSPVAAAPALVNGQYTVTNPTSGNQQFYRLSQ